MENLKFSLRRQLIVVSLLLLSLPWAGCQFIREMEGALADAQEQALKATAQTVAAIAAQRPQLIYPDLQRMASAPDARQSIYVKPAPRAVVVDGYAEDWESVPETRWQAGAALTVRAQAQSYAGTLYLLLRVQDEQLVYYNPGLSRDPNGDRLILRTGRGDAVYDYTLATAAPGRLQARSYGAQAPGVDAALIWGYWQDAYGGYTLELELPLELTGERLGFYVVDSTGEQGVGNQEHSLTAGNIQPGDKLAPPWLIRSPDELDTVLSPFLAQADAVQLIDRERWIVGDFTAPAAAKDTAETFWLLRALYRSILSDSALALPPETDTGGKLAREAVARALAGDLSSIRYRDRNDSNRAVRSVSAPVTHGGKVIGAVVVNQGSERYLSLTDQAFSRLLGYSAMAIGMGAIGLLAYASILSLRIGRLSKAAGNITGPDGSISRNFPASNAPDEIGELSRRFAELLDKLREYNDYLRSLSRKLAHELRTPIAVIQTSLENLEETHSGEQDASPYLSRAREGLLRLNGILQAMSEASRLEESLPQNPISVFDLLPLLRELQQAYSEIYPTNPVTLSATEHQHANIQAAPDLIVQLLDKLVANAVSFSPPGEPVVLSLDFADGAWKLSVSNSGPQLPDAIKTNLFEPMVSSRNTDDGALHLGLGLHIARLISDYLGADIRADNISEPAGVRVTLTLPAQ